jgi:hypothetical protein
MDLIVYTLLSGMAVAYLIELLSSLVERAISARTMKMVLTLPLSYFACWLFNIVGFPLVVCGMAAAFICLLLLLIVNRISEQPMLIRRPF